MTIGTSARSAAACTRSTVSDDRAAAPGSARGVGASCASIWLRSSRSSTMRDSRSASRTTRSASCCTTRGSSVAAIVSASRPSAPIGVFNSWLTLATKSRRTLSTRRRLRDVAGERDRAHDLAVAAQRERAQLEHLARRAVELELALRRDAVERGVQQLVDRVLGEHLAVARAVEAPRRRVAHDLAPDAIDDDDRVGRLVERGEQPVLHRLGARDPVADSRVVSAMASTSATSSAACVASRTRRSSRARARSYRRPTRRSIRQRSDDQSGVTSTPPSRALASVATHPNRPVM